MEELLITKQIENVLLKIVSHQDKPEAIFIYIDSSVDDTMETVPFLNIYGNTVNQHDNLDEALHMAINNCDYGFIEDVLDVVDSSDFEINISAFYPTWPENLEIGDEKIVQIINSVINNNKKQFEAVKKLYFDYIDNFNFVKIID